MYHTWDSSCRIGSYKHCLSSSQLSATTPRSVPILFDSNHANFTEIVCDVFILPPPALAAPLMLPRLVRALALTWACQFLPYTHGVLVNVTVDDDAMTGNKFQYAPDEGWNVGPCSRCWARPDPSSAINHAWHDTTWAPGPSPNDPQTAQIQFNGMQFYALIARAILTNRYRLCYIRLRNRIPVKRIFCQHCRHLFLH